VNFAEHMNKDQRLVLLRLLTDVGGYRSNSSVLWGCMDQLGHVISRDQVKTHLHWLAEQQLVSITEPVPNVLVATLTERGHDVATGRATVFGVARPGA
jgi:hypothetical protein